MLAALVVASFLDIPREPYIAAGLAAYVVALAEPAQRSVLALMVVLPVACGAVCLCQAVVTPAEDSAGAAVVAALVLVVIGGAWGAGFAVRGRRVGAGQEERRRAERAMYEERLRIARELHDIVSRNLGLIAVKAGVAVHVSEADPQEARGALKVIEETSRSALAEMRHTLGVLRTEGAPLGPVPDLGRLGSLVAEANRAGLEIDVTMSGTHGLPEGTQLTIYRIVQEAPLANAVRHAAPTRCRVTVEADTREIRIDVEDDGPPPGRPSANHQLPGGHGPLGMQERAMTYGGGFEAGPGRRAASWRRYGCPPEGRNQRDRRAPGLGADRRRPGDVGRQIPCPCRPHARHDRCG
ncbi:hypothetical protein GCM10010433_27650 [Streptomyces pulveraceus]|uniref:histidine kinase n=1 Tax=Streptomyces pulveraceus TaxID=68258 RepID=A0ABW1GMM2_9ACTN